MPAPTLPLSAPAFWGALDTVFTRLGFGLAGLAGGDDVF